MNLGGRIGYQEGDMAMMQPEGIMGVMPPEAGGMQQGGDQGQTALLTIIQLLIEQGVPPEQATELAMQILQIFNQGGAPAVEEFANQLEQEEGMQQEPMMMAEGGLTSIDRARDMLQRRAPSGEFLAYINPQEAGILRSMGGAGQDVNVRGVPSFFVKKIGKAISGAVKGVASAVKSIAKSPIGMIALSIAAPYALGALTGGAFATFGGTGFAGAALRAGISNLAIQGITTGKINPKQALMAAAGGALAQGVFGPAGGMTPDARDAMNLGDSLQSGQNVIGTPDTLVGNVVQPQMTSGAAFATGADVIDPTRMNLDLSGAGTNYNPMGSPLTESQRLATQAQFGNPLERGIAQAQQFGTRALTGVQDFGTKLMADPVGTIGKGLGSIYDTASQTIKDNPLLSVGGAFLAGQQFRAPLPGEDPNEYNRLKAEHDAQVAGYVTQYGRGAKVFSPGEFGLYAREKAIDPFAGLTTYAANGGRIGYAEGSTSFERQTLEKKGYSDMMKNMTPREISQLYDSVMGTFSRRFKAEGSMPMGEPRRNPAGIMELDYRAKGGFVPPIGIKEKEDDIPAMLSNNEFVFTADAVRAAGGGSVNKGAQRMYGLMKQLESRIA
jgi:hypothetical protein